MKFEVRTTDNFEKKDGLHLIVGKGMSRDGARVKTYAGG